MSSRQEALLDIADIAKRHDLTLSDIAQALEATPEQKAVRTGSILTRVFGYIGGILVFAGLCIFSGMIWDDIGASGRILITLGTGFCAFVMALTFLKDERFEKAATPLFLVAALLQPGGIMVMLKEFSRGGDPAHGILFMTFAMLVQQACAFYATQRTVLGLTSVIFGLGFFVTAFDLLGIGYKLGELVIGMSLMCIAWSLDNSRHKAVAPLCYFLGSILLLWIGYDLLKGKPFEILYLGLSCGLIFLSTVARSRILLITSTLATLGYIGYFSGKYFAHTLGWPLLMILMGFVLIGLGSVAVKINNKYIKQG